MSKTKYGVQVDAWAPLIPGKRDASKEIYKHVWKTINEQLPYMVDQYGVSKPGQLTAIEGDLVFANFLNPFKSREKKRPHMLVTNTLSEFSHYTVAVRIAGWGLNDLEVSWRILEKDVVQTVIEPLLHVFCGVLG